MFYQPNRDNLCLFENLLGQLATTQATHGCFRNEPRIDSDFPIWPRHGHFRRGPATSPSRPVDRYLFLLFWRLLLLEFSSSHSPLAMSPAQDGHDKPSTSILKERRFKLSR